MMAVPSSPTASAPWAGGGAPSRRAPRWDPPPSPPGPACGSRGPTPPRARPLCAAEVPGGDRLRDPGAPRDLLDRRRLVAALGEDLPSDLDQLCPARRGGKPRPSLRPGCFGHVDISTTQA